MQRGSSACLGFLWLPMYCYVLYLHASVCKFIWSKTENLAEWWNEMGYDHLYIMLSNGKEMYFKFVYLPCDNQYWASKNINTFLCSFKLRWHFKSRGQKWPHCERILSYGEIISKIDVLKWKRVTLLPKLSKHISYFFFKKKRHFIYYTLNT